MGFFSSLLSKLFGGSGSGPTVRRGSEEELIQHARQLVDENKLEQALEVLRRAGDQHPHSEVIAELTASVEESFVHSQIGSLQAQLQEQSSPELLCRLAELYRRLSDMAQAMKYGREAIDEDSQNPIGYRTVGRLYLEQFRVAQTSVQGINAVRYLSKAHALDPRDSRILLNLAEIFVVLRAPLAARKFLGPVLSAFPNDPAVIRLEERARDLPNEGTSQIQDLFLRHEQRVSGEAPVSHAAVDLPQGFDDQLQELAESIEGTQGVYLVDGDRNLIARYSSCGWTNDTLGESLGLVRDTAQQNSQRMSIGAFHRLVVNGPENFTMIEAVSEDLTIFFIGKKNTKQGEVEGFMTKVVELTGNTVEATQ